MSAEDSKQISPFTKIKYLGKVLRPKDKIIIYAALTLLLVLLIGGSIRYYLSVTKVIPTNGGEYTEGIAIDSSGVPTNINPLLAIARPIDELITSVVYSSLFKYDTNGQLVGDLVENYEVSDDGKTYTLHLKQGVTWHDGQPLTAKDVLFTIQLFQDSNYNPVGTQEWNKEKIKTSNPDEYTVKIELSEPYAPFLSKLTFGILPKHLWSEISGDKFALTDLNLEPVGSGPFIFDEIKKNSNGDIISYKLVSNKNYYGKKPFLDRLIFNFYADQESVMQAYDKKEISGFSLSSYEKAEEFKSRKDTSVYSMSIPQYFSVLLNQGESVPLADTQVRQALRMSVDRDKLVQDIFNGYAEKIYSPMLKPFIPEDFNYDEELIKYDPEEAKKMLDKAGWKKEDDSSVRKKDGQELKIQLVTASTEALTKTAEIIKNEWEQLGISVEIVQAENQLDIKQKYLNPRKFESLISGFQYSGNDPNLFFFWHSTGKKAPGFNFTLYDNEKVDKLLEESKRAKTQQEKNEKYIEVSKQLLQDSPAIFLYSPKYIYITNKKIQGLHENQAIVKTTNRLNNISEWYTKTKRTKK